MNWAAFGWFVCGFFSAFAFLCLLCEIDRRKSRRRRQERHAEAYRAEFKCAVSGRVAHLDLQDLEGYR